MGDSLEVFPVGSATAGQLFDLVRKRRAMTRSDLRRITGLSRTAVTSRVTALAELGLVAVGEPVLTTGGRPSGSLALNADAGVVLAIAIGRSRSQLGVFDLSGAEQSADSVEHPVGIRPDELMPTIVDRLGRQLEHESRPIRAVGLSLPGTVDQARGMSIATAVLPGWDGVDLKAFLAPLTMAPLFMGNDAAVLARSELLARPDELTDVLVLKASTGLSIGIIAGGEVTNGYHGGAGELGHSKHPAAAGLLCRCGSTGCLEAVAGGWALVGEMAESPRKISHIRDLVSIAREGDREARALLRRAGHLSGELLAVVINALNPQAVVVGGDMSAAFDLYVSGLRESVYAHASPFAARSLEFLPATHGDRAGLVGCAALALDMSLSATAVDADVARLQ